MSEKEQYWKLRLEAVSKALEQNGIESKFFERLIMHYGCKDTVARDPDKPGQSRIFCLD